MRSLEKEAAEFVLPAAGVRWVAYRRGVEEAAKVSGVSSPSRDGVLRRVARDRSYRHLAAEFRTTSRLCVVRIADKFLVSTYAANKKRNTSEFVLLLRKFKMAESVPRSKDSNDKQRKRRRSRDKGEMNETVDEGKHI